MYTGSIGVGGQFEPDCAFDMHLVVFRGQLSISGERGQNEHGVALYTGSLDTGLRTGKVV